MNEEQLEGTTDADRHPRAIPTGPSANPVVLVLTEVFGPMIAQTTKLPAPLAYGLLALIGLLVILLLGAVLPTSVVWLIGFLLLSVLATYVFVEWLERRPPPESAAASNYIVYAAVHAADRETSLIPDARVTLVLPEPIVRKTQENGQTYFNIPGIYAGQQFAINASKAGYRSPPDLRLTVGETDRVLIPLEPVPDADGPAGKSSPEVTAGNRDAVDKSQSASVFRLQKESGSGPDSFSSTERTISVGRAGHSMVQISDPTVSWDHGEIKLLAGIYQYHHLSESSDTIIKSRIGKETRIVRPGDSQYYPLYNQDRITIGDATFLVTYTLLAEDEVYIGTAPRPDEDTDD